jgi:cation:H+ antiporter
MLVSLLILIAGFALLIKSADILVEGSSSIAKKFGISTIVIGLTVVAFGTSAPELVVNIISSIQGSSEIAVGNILGSNIANILLILGVAAVIRKLGVKRSTSFKEVPLLILAVIVLGLLANDQLIDHSSPSMISRIDGLVMLGFFVIFLYYTFGIARVSGEEIKVKPRKTWLSTIMVLGGIIGLTIGGKLVVDHAINIASLLNVSEALIGLTIVALGTSLPELVTAGVAAYKNQVDLAVGNVIGSNIFNIFWILGLSATIRPLPFDTNLNFDVLITLVTSLILFIFIINSKPHVIKKWEGVGLLLMYCVYIVFLIVRG